MKKIDKKIETFLYPVVIESCEDGGFFASCPILQGCHAEGETYAQTLEIIEDVIRLHLELRRKKGDFVSSVSLPTKEKIKVSLPVLVQV